VVNDMCFSVLLDNPLQYFNDKNFLEMTPQGLKSLVHQSRFNCSEEQLKEAVLKWLQHKEEETNAGEITFNPDTYKALEKRSGIKEANLMNKQFFNLKTDSFGQFELAMFQVDRTICNINRSGNKTKYLHGLGIYTGVEFADWQETITITLSEYDEKKNCTKLKTLTKVMKQERCISICHLIFEKIEIKQHLLCEIDFGSFKSRYNSKTVCSEEHNHFESGCMLVSHDGDSFVKSQKFTCVAYLLYSDGQKTDVGGGEMAGKWSLDGDKSVIQ
jgi:hypothetical protein